MQIFSKIFLLRSQSLTRHQTSSAQIISIFVFASQTVFNLKNYWILFKTPPALFLVKMFDALIMFGVRPLVSGAGPVPIHALLPYPLTNTNLTTQSTKICCTVQRSIVIHNQPGAPSQILPRNIRSLLSLSPPTNLSGTQSDGKNVGSDV